MSLFGNSICLLAAAIGMAHAAHAGTITVKGSDTLLLLARKWAEVYMAEHSGTKIQVMGGGSGLGFAALQDKSTVLADASRPIHHTEIAECIRSFGQRPTEYKVCLDGLSIFVAEDNPVTELTVEELRRIFVGRIKNWKEVGGHDTPINIYSREHTSGTYDYFKEHVLDGGDFVASAQPMPGTAALLQAVARDVGGIGYGGVAYGRSARTLKIKKDAQSPAIEPTEENVVKGLYPIWRYLYIYVNPAIDRGEVAAYLNWIRSDAGQAVVPQIGYFPLPARLRETK